MASAPGSEKGMIRQLQRLRGNLSERLHLLTTGRVICDTSQMADVGSVSLPDVFDALKCEPEWNAANPLHRLQIPEKSWGVNQGDRRALFHLMRGLRPRQVLEIGTHIGASTVHIAAALTLTNSPASRLVTVDIVDMNHPVTQPWRSFGANASPRDLVQMAGVGEVVEFVTERSLDYLNRCEDQFDLIFLDGDHRATTVYQEVPRAARLLAPGGWILLHDYYPNLRPLCGGDSVIDGPFLALRRLKAHSADLEVLPLGMLPWPTKPGCNATTLALLGRRGPELA